MASSVGQGVGQPNLWLYLNLLFSISNNNKTFSLTCCLTFLQRVKAVFVSWATAINERLALSTDLVKVIFWDIEFTRALILWKKAETS